MSSDKSYLARVQSMPRYYAGGLYRELSEKTVFLFAQAIAFKVLVTIVPIVILLTGILGGVLRYQEPFSAVARFVRGFLPPRESDQLLEFLGAFQGSSGAFLSIGTIGLVLTAMTLATTVRVAVSSAFEQDWNEDRSLLGGYAFDLRMVGQVGLLFLLTVGLSFLVQAFNAEGLEFMKRLGLDRWLRAGWRNAFDAFSLVVPLLVSATMFFQLFYFIPLPHPPRGSAALGAFVTAVLWEAAKYGFALYTTYVGTFRYETASDGMAALGNTFGLVIAFVIWVYYSGIVLMVGAVVASLHEQRKRVLESEGRSITPGSKLDAAVYQHPPEERFSPFGTSPTDGPAAPKTPREERGGHETSTRGTQDLSPRRTASPARPLTAEAISSLKKQPSEKNREKCPGSSSPRGGTRQTSPDSPQHEDVSAAPEEENGSSRSTKAPSPKK